MYVDFHSAEESLKEYLAEEQVDKYNSRSTNAHKYNNLKIFMEPKKNPIPHFSVRIGISEATYKLNGQKLSGGLGVDERYVRRWIERNLTRLDLNTMWINANKVEEIKLEGEVEY